MFGVLIKSKFVQQTYSQTMYRDVHCLARYLRRCCTEINLHPFAGTACFAVSFLINRSDRRARKEYLMNKKRCRYAARL